MFESRDYISDYESETSSNIDRDSEISQSDIPPSKDKELWEKPARPRFPAYGNSKAVLDAENKRAYNSTIRHHLLNLDAFERHKKLVNDYLQYYGGSWKDFQRDTSKDKTDIDVIKEHGRFLWSEEDEATSWSDRLAKKYWEKLFKEYCLIDLSRYKENKFGMRWRLEKEVISGKGQFTCGNVACPAGSERLRSWEVNFVYQERGERRNALVKIRLCPPCSEKLNYRYRRRDVTGKQLNLHQGHDERITNPQETNNGDDKNIESSSTSPSSKRPRIDDANDNCDNVKSLLSEDKSADLNSVWCCQSGQNSSKKSTATSYAGGTIKTQGDEFDEYFADMLM
ncbi:unnamed protein product [Schistosoma rodhaini]|uniref:Protein FRA10AC1 n=1 Tax=Schistosoma rodhaini TaxID=6188 RepID=A0AA85GA07_9TREM|nr:unnamed protein product [Schistosoma rodhaini]CAH8623689.1 unnamed protein product [Schistosoma rodhaini]